MYRDGDSYQNTQFLTCTEGHTDGYSFGKGVESHRAYEQQDPAGSYSLKVSKVDLFLLEQPLPDEDEDDTQQPSSDGLPNAVGRCF